PNYVFTTFDNKFQLYNGSITLSTCSTTTGTATCNISPAAGVWEAGDTVCLAGISVSAYNICPTLTAVTYNAGSPNLNTSVSFTRGGLPASAPGGSIRMACGGALPGRVAAPCQIAPVIRHGLNGTIVVP